MSTPPIPPASFDARPPKRKRSTLAKLAIAFAITMVVTFGLCSITLANSNSAMNGPVFPAAIIIEALCIIGLIVIFFMAIFKKPQSK
jgi:hypothetical protein